MGLADSAPAALRWSSPTPLLRSRLRQTQARNTPAKEVRTQSKSSGPCQQGSLASRLPQGAHSGAMNQRRSPENTDHCIVRSRVRAYRDGKLLARMPKEGQLVTVSLLCTDGHITLPAETGFLIYLEPDREGT